MKIHDNFSCLHMFGLLLFANNQYLPPAKNILSKTNDPLALDGKTIFVQEVIIDILSPKNCII